MVRYDSVKKYIDVNVVFLKRNNYSILINNRLSSNIIVDKNILVMLVNV